MTSKLKLIVATFLLSIVFIEPVLATGSMRCGTHVISAGYRDSPGKYEVLKRCGEPKARYGDTWVYEKSSSVSRVLRFTSDGQIKSIE